MSTETVKVVTDLFESGFMIIDKDDYNEDEHVLFSEKKTRGLKKADPPVKTAAEVSEDDLKQLSFTKAKIVALAEELGYDLGVLDEDSTKSDLIEAFMLEQNKESE